MQLPGQIPDEHPLMFYCLGSLQNMVLFMLQLQLAGMVVLGHLEINSSVPPICQALWNIGNFASQPGPTGSCVNVNHKHHTHIGDQQKHHNH